MSDAMIQMAPGSREIDEILFRWRQEWGESTCGRDYESWLEDRLLKAEAVIERLPKMKTGQPILFGETYWFYDDENDILGQITVRDIESPYKDVDWLISGKQCDVYAPMIYATQSEAEEAASKAEY
jgi:hypothetical protein